MDLRKLGLGRWLCQRSTCHTRMMTWVWSPAPKENFVIAIPVYNLRAEQARQEVPWSLLGHQPYQMDELQVEREMLYQKRRWRMTEEDPSVNFWLPHMCICSNTHTHHYRSHTLIRKRKTMCSWRKQKTQNPLKPVYSLFTRSFAVNPTPLFLRLLSMNSHTDTLDSLRICREFLKGIKHCFQFLVISGPSVVLFYIFKALQNFKIAKITIRVMHVHSENLMSLNLMEFSSLWLH